MRQIAKFSMGMIVLAASLVSAQSLGDYAKSVRKDKAQPTTVNKHYDNDNLPKSDHLSVVGQPPAQVAEDTQAKTDDSAKEEKAKEEKPKADAATEGKEATAAPKEEKKDEAAEQQKMYEDWKKRIEAQKKEIAALERELDVTNREYRLRAAAMYADVGNRLRNSAEWDKEDREYKQQVAEKENAVKEAKQKLDDMKEEARQQGVPSSTRE